MIYSFAEPNIGRFEFNLAPRYLILTYIFLTLSCCYYYYYNYNRQLAAQLRTLYAHTEAARQQINHYIEYSFKELLDIETVIKKSDRSDLAIYDILRQRVDEGDGVVRFGWSNADGRLVAGSAKGVYSTPADISARDYYHHARLFPGNLYLGEAIAHIRTGRKLIPITLGISHGGRYLGNLLAAINLDPLQLMIHQRLQSQPMDYAVFSPHLAFIDARGYTQQELASIQQRLTRTNAFHVISRLPETLQREMLRQTLAQCLLMLSIIHGILLVGYRVIRSRILKPVEKTVSRFEPHLSTSASDLQPFKHRPLAEKLQAMNELATRWHEMESQYHEQQRIISRCMAHIESMQQQQERFLFASSEQMQEMFDKIQAYGRHLEEMVMHKQLHPDAPYEFDDVREMGENLKHLAECYLLFTQTPEPSHHMIDPKAVLDRCLAALMPLIERRNLAVSFTQARHVWMIQDNTEQVLEAVFRSILYACIRHAADESTLSICVNTKGESATLEFHLSRVSVPHVSDNHDVIERLSHHANMMVADVFLAHVNSELLIQPDAQTGGVRVSLQLSTLTDLAVE